MTLSNIETNAMEYKHERVMSVASKYLYLKSSYHSRISMTKKIMRTNLRYHFVQNDKVS